MPCFLCAAFRDAMGDQRYTFEHLYTKNMLAFYAAFGDAMGDQRYTFEHLYIKKHACILCYAYGIVQSQP